MTRLWLVRHGPTHEKAFVGWRDVPADLSDQALVDKVDAYLPQKAVVVASDLRRASDTASAIGKTRRRLTDIAALREFNFGDWDGMNFQDVARQHPERSRRFWEEPGDIAPPSGESWNDVATRVGVAIDTLLHDHAGQDVVLVAHIGVIMTQIQRACRCTAYEAMGHQIDNLSTTDMTWHGDEWKIGRINHIP